MNYTQLSDALAPIVEAADPLARVHKYPRYGDATEHYVVDTGVDVPHIRGWEIGLEEPGLIVNERESRHYHRYWPVAIRGYFGVVDNEESYRTLCDTATAIVEALHADRTLGGLILETTEEATFEEPVPVQIGGGALCWSTAIRLTAYEIVSV